MKRRAWIFLILCIVIIPFTNPFFDRGKTQDCFVQIVAVNIDQASYQIGEAVNITIVYDMYYDLFDPLGAGSISVNVVVQGESLPLISHQFTDIGLNINKSLTIALAAPNWEPNVTGQIGIIQVQGWVEDSTGTMTDNAELQFSVLRSDVIIHTLPLPMQITYHDIFQVQGSFENPHNASTLVPLHPFVIIITHDSKVIQEWNGTSTQTSGFVQEIDTAQLGTGTFSCNITTLPTGDYNPVTTLFSFDVSNSSISLTPFLNTTSVQAYYPLTGNSSILVSTSLSCLSTNHSMQEANLTCELGNVTTPMVNVDSNQFIAELTAPNIPGNYTVIVTANIPHHNTTSKSVPIRVLPRRALLGFESNCTEAALGDILEFSLSAKAEGSVVSIGNKICSIYLYNQSVWNLLTQFALDSNGTGQFLWQAQHVGDQDFQFRMVFQGGPEFDDEEMELVVTNTHEIRFILNSTFQVLRQTNIQYLVQLTSLDYQPLTDVSLELLELSTNITWCITTTNSSGFAEISCYIEEWYELGIHEFLLIARQGIEVVEEVPITMIVFDQTVLELT